jgi:hypothetical protein
MSERAFKETRIEGVIRCYDRIQCFYDGASKSPFLPPLRAAFDEHIPECKAFTDVKKLDLYLWQARDA